MTVINTNVAAQLARKNLQSSAGSLQTSLERLSSGLRINSAKDDAAGQAIANRFTSQINGLSVAQRNANDGISIAQTAEGALNQVTDNLQRIRELTVQASNGTNSSADLKSIQDEIKQRLSEIDRISEQTEFNGNKVLANNKSFNIQVGAKDGETIKVDLETTTASSLSLASFNVTGPNGTLTAVDSGAKAQAIFGTDTGVTDTKITDRSASLAAKLGIAATSVKFGSTAGAVAGNTDDVLRDADGNLFVRVDISAANTAEELALKANGFDNVKAGAPAATTFYIAVESKDAAFSTVTTPNDTATFDVGTNVDLSALRNSRTGNALAAVDSALSKVDTFRSKLGAVQNRLTSAVQNLATNQTNLSAARSRIQDADIAVEVANLTRAQILQQAGTSVLAQANQAPQSVLSLLR